MTKTGIIRLSIALGSTAVILTSAGLGLAFGLPTLQGSHSNLRMVINGKNELKWYQFDPTFSYGSFTSGSFTSGGTPHAAQLVRKAAVGENAKVIDKEEPVKDDLLNLKDSPYPFHEFYKFELAKAVVIYQGETTYLFNNDIYDFKNVPDDIKNQSINSPYFMQMLDDPNTSSIEFVIRENVPWVNNRGEIAKNSEGKPYEVIPEDWVYGIYRTVMTSNTNRNSPFEQTTNPFGGFGVKPSDETFQKWTQRWWDLSAKFKSVSGSFDFITPTGGYSNSYVYDLLGIYNPTELVQPQVPFVDRPQMIGTYNSKKTVRFPRKENLKAGVEVKFKEFFGELIVRNQDFIPAPSQYIADVASKVDEVAGIHIPKPGDPGIVSGEINIRKYGIFSYGTEIDKTLFSSAYYVSKNNTFSTEQNINPHYWDSDWVTSSQSVKSLVTDYLETSDQRIFAQSVLEQYRNGRVFTLDMANQPPLKVSEIKKQGQSNGLRYTQKILNKQFVADIFPLMLPKPGVENYKFNDNFAKVWFGASTERIKKGEMQISDYTNKWSIAARSQMIAAINWYSQSRTISENDNFEAWYSYLPPDVPFNTKGNKGNEKIYDFKKQLNTISYWIVNEKSGQLERKFIEEQENIDQYNRSKTQIDSLKSAKFDEIKIEFARTIAHFLGNNPGELQFAFSNRDIATLTSQGQLAMQQFKTIFEMLHPQLKPTVYISLSNDNLLPYINSQISIGQFHNWGPDYVGIGSWLSGMARERFGIQATALAIANSDDQNVKNSFKHLKEYGDTLAKEINSAVQDWFTKAGRTDLLRYYADANEIKNKNNDERHNLGSSSLISRTLLDLDGYNNLPIEDKLVIDQANQSFQKTIATIDYGLQQNGKTAEWFVELFNEQMSIMGKYPGTKEIAIPTKTRYVESLWQPWLIWSKLASDIYYLQDIKIIK